MSNFTAYNWLTSSGKYPDRSQHKEVNLDLLNKAFSLVTKVNRLLTAMGDPKCSISSGFRPSDVNKKTPNAAGKSNHMDGDAVDLDNAQIGKDLKADYEKNGEGSWLVKHDMYLEDPEFTPKWTHLQDEPPKSGKRIFIPQ